MLTRTIMNNYLNTLCFLYLFCFHVLKYWVNQISLTVFISLLHSKTNTYLPNPSARAGYDTRSIFKRSLIGLNSKFSFSLTSCLTKAEVPSLSYNLRIAGGRIIGFKPFPRVLVIYEMQSVSSRIWTRVAVSISYDDNHYTTGTYILKQITWLVIFGR